MASWFWVATWLLADAEGGLLDRLEPPQRAAVIMTLIGLVILTFGMIVLIVLGGRWLRRRNRQLRDPHPSQLDDAWWEKPLVPPLDDEPDAEDAGETTGQAPKSD